MRDYPEIGQRRGTWYNTRTIWGYRLDPFMESFAAGGRAHLMKFTPESDLFIYVGKGFNMADELRIIDLKMDRLNDRP